MNRAFGLTARTALSFYTVFMVAYAAADVGKPEQCDHYTWALPVTVFLITACPAFLGYLIGRNHE